MYEVTFKDEQGQPMELLGVSVLQLQDLVERCEEVWRSAGKCGKVSRCWQRAGGGPGAVLIEMQCAGVAVGLCSLDRVLEVLAVPCHTSCTCGLRHSAVVGWQRSVLTPPTPMAAVASNFIALCCTGRRCR